MTNKRAQKTAAKTAHAVKAVHKPVKDFKKLKAKVGKKAPTPTSATNVNFSVKSVNVPTQGILAEKSEYVTKRRLDLTDLMGQCQHYSANVRKEAYTGLKDLLNLHPMLLVPNFSIVIHGVIGGMVDVDKQVRIGLLALLEHLFSSCPEQDKLHIASACIPLIVGYVASAMSHIEKPIRKDSISFLDLVLKHFAPLVWKDAHIKQILPNLQNVFADRASMQLITSASVDAAKGATKVKKNGSKKTFEAALRCLRVMAELVPQHQQQTSSSSLLSTPSVSSDSASTASPATTSSSSSSSSQTFSTPLLTARVSSSLNDLITTSHTVSVDCEKWACAMIPILIECWVEIQVDPGVLAKPLLQCIEALLRVIRTEQLFSFFNQFSKFIFPAFDQSSSNRNSERDFLLCRIMSLFLPVVGGNLQVSSDDSSSSSGSGSSNSQRKGSKRQKTNEEVPSAKMATMNEFSTRLVTYVTDSFVNRAPTASQLLPIIDSLLPRLSSSQANGVMEAVSQYYFSLQSKSHAKIACLEFMNNLFKPPLGVNWISIAKKWVTSVITELCSKDFGVKEIDVQTQLVMFLATCLRYYSNLMQDELTEAPRAFICVFGSPILAQLSTSVQAQAIHSIFCLHTLDNSLLKTLTGCVRDSKLSPALKTALVDMVVLSFSRGAKLPLPSLVTFLLSVARCPDVLPTVCRSLRLPTQLGSDWMLEVVAPQLQTLATKQDNTYMVLRLVESCRPCHEVSPTILSLFDTLTPLLGNFFLEQLSHTENVRLVLNLFFQVPMLLPLFFTFLEKNHMGDARLLVAVLILVRSPVFRSHLLGCKDSVLSILQVSAADSRLVQSPDLALLKSELFVLYA